MKNLNRNNADIKKILNKKVAIVCPTKEKELDFRKWAKQYVNAVDEDWVYTNCGNGICITLEYDGLKWDYTKYFLEDNYSIYEWEIAEEEKIYTIKDVVENEGKIYRSITNKCIYKYDKHSLYYKSMRKLSDDWRKTELTLGEILELELVEYKPEPKKITFEEAFKEMEEGNVCRCLFSNRCITRCITLHCSRYDSHFVDAGNGGYTNLSLSEIQSEWVVID